MLDANNYFYLDETLENFSNLAFGLIIQKIGEGKKIAYLNCENTASKLINFFENLTLTSNFKGEFKNSEIDIFSLKKLTKINPKNKDDKNNTKLVIQRSIISQVEYQNINLEIFLKNINNYDLVIIDNFNSVDFLAEKIEFTNFLDKIKTQVVLTTKHGDIFKKYKKLFKNKVKCNLTLKKNLLTKKSLINITGKQKGKTLYALGFLLRKYLYKADVRLIYFDKICDIFGDFKFFEVLKKWNSKNTFYGSFDFVKTGVEKLDDSQIKKLDKKSINEIFEQNKKEAYQALELFKTSLKNNYFVIADEINLAIKKKYLELSDVLDVINNSKNSEMILTGDITRFELNKITEMKIEFKNSL